LGRSQQGLTGVASDDRMPALEARGAPANVKSGPPLRCELTGELGSLASLLSFIAPFVARAP
jgi:hypothetical protein